MKSKRKPKGYYADGDGLYLQVSATGSRSWVIRYKVHGRARDMGLGPIAIAAIGSLPLPTLARSIVIHMERSDGVRKLRRLDDPEAIDDLNAVYRYVHAWARDVTLNLDPPLPKELKNRVADNWRPLISIGDAFGAQFGADARDAAVTLVRGHSDEDIVVTLLTDIHTVFGNDDRLASINLLQRLMALEDGGWEEFRGPQGDQYPRKLTQSILAMMLRPFGIQPRTIWFSKDRREGSRKGYERSQFQSAWSRYCSTSAQRRNINKLCKR